MKFGIIPVNVGVRSPEQVISLAQTAEDAGFESVWTFEHIIVPIEYESKYPYHESGKFAAKPETNFVDPLIALTAVAMETKTIRLGTGVNIVSQTNPMSLAKQSASLDFISNGRFMLGAGIGWLKEEFKVMGVPFERRGARFDDYMEAFAKIWSGDVVEHESDFVSWHNFKSYPVPVQTPRGATSVPIIIGGQNSKIYDRIAKYGDGWFIPPSPDWSTPKDGDNPMADSLEKLKAACAAHGRDYESIELTTFWNPATGPDSLKALEELGIERVVVVLGMLGDNPYDGMKALAGKYI